MYLERLQSADKPLTERTLRQIKRHCAKIKHGLWPGHLVALDSFEVGHLKGVGRIYQLTGLDLCPLFGWAKLYTQKDQRAAIDLVEQVLIPRFYANGVRIESILTDNGSEFIGSRFRQMLTDYNIQHHRIPPGKPMLNGYCERFQRTLAEEFYQPVFRTTFFHSLTDLQCALDKYLIYYNFHRVHFGLAKNGEIPINVFKEKQLTIRHQFQKLLT